MQCCEGRALVLTDIRCRKQHPLLCSAPVQHDGCSGPRPPEEQQLEAFQARVRATLSWGAGVGARTAAEATVVEQHCLSATVL